MFAFVSFFHIYLFIFDYFSKELPGSSPQQDSNIMSTNPEYPMRPHLEPGGPEISTIYKENNYPTIGFHNNTTTRELPTVCQFF